MTTEVFDIKKVNNQVENIKACKGQIYEYLNSNTTVKRSVLLNHLLNLGFKVSDRGMRKMIEDLVMYEDVKIGTDLSGYFLIRTDADLQRAMKCLKSKAYSLFARANKLRAICGKNEVAIQTGLFDV